MATAATARAPSAALRPLLAATALSVTGDGAFAAGAGLLAVALTRDPVTVALVETVMYGTRIVFQLPAGALADRWPRRRVMIAADLARAAILAALVALIATHAATVALLLACVAAVTAFSCLFSPAAQAVIPEVLGQDANALAAFNGRYWMTYAVGKDLAGPPLGAALFAAGRALPFAADAASFAGSALLLRRLPSHPAPAREGRPRLTAGLRHVLAHRELRALTFGIAADNLAAACVTGIFVLYARVTLHVPPAAYGLLLAAGVPAALAAGLNPGLLARRLTARQTVAVCALAEAAGWAVLAAFPSIWAAILAMLILGASGVWATAAVTTAYQTATPGPMLGAAMAALLAFGVGAAGIGALAGGAVARLAGLNAAVIAAAVIAGVTGIAVAGWHPGAVRDR